MAAPLHEMAAMATVAPPPSSRRRTRMSSKCDRVLIYTTCYNVIDGVTLTIRKLEQEILASGGHVCVLTTRSGDPAHTHQIGRHPNRTVLFLDNSVPIPFIYDPENPDAQYHLGFSLSDAVKSTLDEFRPSVVHITVPDCTGLYVVDYARSRQLPLMGTYHSNIVDYLDHYPGVSWAKPIIGAFFRHQYNFIPTLFVPTPYIKRHLIETDKMDKVTNLKIWARGVDIQRFSPQHRSLTFRRNLGIADDVVVILFVGRLVPEKRCDIFISVIRRLNAERVKFKALVVGAGPYQDEMKALKNTTCTGWLSGDELAVAYASSDIFLFPSSVETFGNVTLEAAASGLPLVVEAGCSGHLVDDGENGFSCATGDVGSFYRATLSLIVDPDLRAALASRSRPHALTYEKSEVSQQMLRNYEGVVEEFFAEYGGRHENRDAAFVNDHSFRSGRLPRPYGMGLVEAFFVTTFRVMHAVLMGYLLFQEGFLTPILVFLGLAQRPVAAEAALQSEEEEYASTTTAEKVVIEDLNDEVIMSGGGDDAKAVAHHKPLTLSESTLTGLTSSTSSQTSSSDDAVSDGSNFDFESASLSAGVRTGAAGAIANFGDGPVCRLLAVYFVRVVYFGWRTSASISLSLTAKKELQRRWKLEAEEKIKVR